MGCNIPDIIPLSSVDGDYEAYEDTVYKEFCECFENKEFKFRGVRVGHKRHPEYNGKSATFWHIISEGADEQNRLPDLRRYERIRWPFYIMEHCIDNCSDLLIWENERRGQTRILIFCTHIDYLLVFAKRDGYVIFWTAYPVTENHRKRKLLNEYKAYKAKAAQP